MVLERQRLDQLHAGKAAGLLQHLGGNRAVDREQQHRLATRLTCRSEDALDLTEYVSGALASQSFNRNETREVIARVARHALREAVTALRVYEPENREHKAALFEIAQLLNLTSTSRTVTRLGARLDSISPELAELARERENLRRKWQETDRENEPDEKKRLQDAVDALDTRLKKEFPEYDQQVPDDPWSLIEVFPKLITSVNLNPSLLLSLALPFREFIRLS